MVFTSAYECNHCSSWMTNLQFLIKYYSLHNIYISYTYTDTSTKFQVATIKRKCISLWSYNITSPARPNTGETFTSSFTLLVKRVLTSAHCDHLLANCEKMKTTGLHEVKSNKQGWSWACPEPSKSVSSTKS